MSRRVGDAVSVVFVQFVRKRVAIYITNVQLGRKIAFFKKKSLHTRNYWNMSIRVLLVRRGKASFNFFSSQQINTSETKKLWLISIVDITLYRVLWAKNPTSFLPQGLLKSQGTSSPEHLQSVFSFVPSGKQTKFLWYPWRTQGWDERPLVLHHFLDYVVL